MVRSRRSGMPVSMVGVLQKCPEDMLRKIKSKFEPYLGNALLQSRTQIFFRETRISSYRDLARIICGYEIRAPKKRIIFSNDKLNLLLKAIKIAGNANRNILASPDHYHLYHLQLGKLLPSQNKMPSFQEKLDAFKRQGNEKAALKILTEICAIELRFTPQMPDFL